MKRIRVITSYSGLARFLAECADDAIGYIPRPKDIPSPYHYSAAWEVLDWNGRRVIRAEVSHRRYEIYELPANATVYASDEEAMNIALA